MEKIFNFNVVGQKIVSAGVRSVVSNTYNIYKVHFDFSADWNNLTSITAVFKSGKAGTVYEVLLSNTHECKIPSEVLADSGIVYVGAFGTGATSEQYPTEWSLPVSINEGVCEGQVPSEPTPSVYAQILTELSHKPNEAPLDNKTYGRKNGTWAEVSAGSDTNAVHYTADSGKTEEEKAQARTNIGAGTSSFSGDYEDLTDKPVNVSHFTNDAGYITSASLSPYRTAAAQDIIDQGKASASDLSAHTSNSNIHVTTSDKSTWSAKYDRPASGIPKSDLAGAVQTSLGKADTAIQEHQSLSAYRTSAAQDIIDNTKASTTDLTTHTSNTTIHVTSENKSAWSAKYDLPEGGIPKNDLSSGVKTSLGLADSALQEHQSLAAYRTSANQDVIDQGIIGQIPDVIDSVTSSSTTNALSANMGFNLQTQITNLKSIGRFLAIWNAQTGLPTSNPTTLPYTYKTGDYFRVGTVSATTNYMPNGSSYTGTASTTVYTGTDLTTGAVFYYDGSAWNIQASGGGGTVQDVQMNGVSILNGAIANVPIASTTLGVVKQGTNKGVAIAADGVVSTVKATPSEIAGRTDNNAVIVPSNLNDAVKASLTDTNHITGLTTAEQATARSVIGAGVGSVTDVQVNDVSVVSNGVADISIAGTGTLGVSQYPSGNGLSINSSTGSVSTEKAIESELIAKTQNYKPVVPANLDIAIREGLGNNALTWSSAYQASARETIGIEEFTAAEIDTLWEGTA